MARAAELPLPQPWAKFAQRYARDHAYWYQPKGLAADVEEIATRLEPLVAFEGKQPWKDCQADYIRALNKLGVSAAEGPALARMLKQVFGVLGLAWVNATDLVEITPVGEAFLAASDRAEILAAQAMRYQFCNPSIASEAHEAVQLHPVPFMARLLSTLQTGISGDEYNLFVARAKSFDEVDDVAADIEAYRDLSPEQQVEIKRQCRTYQIGGAKRRSLLKTVELSRPYALRMWMLSGLFERNDDHGLDLKPHVLRGATRKWLDGYAVNGTYISFQTKKAYFAWWGDPNAKPDKSTALGIYTQRGDIQAATALKKRMNASSSEVNELRYMMRSEKALEDAIEQEFATFAKCVGRPLKLVGRQYDTTVGPIDLLAQDAKTKTYTVIELKKGRASDKVFGQLSRYMGWVRTNLAQGKPVKGMIVGREIDEKLRAARNAFDASIDLVRYQSSKIEFSLD